jgi:hypothetical protein
MVTHLRREHEHVDETITRLQTSQRVLDAALRRADSRDPANHN